MEIPLITKTGWGTTERERDGEMMQCFMKKDDTGLIYVDTFETTYFENCAFFAAFASFLLQLCLIHLSLASLAFCATYFTFISGVFIRVLSCCRYPSQHRYDFCARIAICVVGAYLFRGHCTMLHCHQDVSIQDMTSFAIPLTWVYIKY